MYFALSAQDDETPSDSMGYVFSLADGDARYTPPAEPLAAADGVVTFHVVHGGGAIRYDLEVRAVDQAGNVGPATLIEVRNGTGCAIGGGASGALPALLAVAFLALRRRRR
ncbi:MAG: hypothetical protein GXP55_10030 [Deltaproteobacteria bacterium]|nr:hypothetical protein [Deltaproteobacteria bacterium]